MQEGAATGNKELALLLYALAGLSTRSSEACWGLRFENRPKLMTPMLGFFEGVMIHVSPVELLQSSVGTDGFMPSHFAFFPGMNAVW